MRFRFSCVAFVPSNAQLGVTGGAPFLGEWDVTRCVPLIPYSPPNQTGVEPSLWFRDIEIDSAHATSLNDGMNRKGNGDDMPDGVTPGYDGATASTDENEFCFKLISAVQYVCSRRSKAVRLRRASDEEAVGGSGGEESELASVVDAGAYHLDPRNPDMLAILELHPLRKLSFEYKFVIWYPDSPALPYVPTTLGNGSTAYGPPSWRSWLFPPPPAQVPTPPIFDNSIIWEGTGPDSNRRFSFDPYDVVVDECETGEPVVLYLNKIAAFKDSRASGTSEMDHTSRFYSIVKTEGNMNYSKILPNLFVGSCPRQLKHLRRLKHELHITAIFNLQTKDDLIANYPDPIASTRSPEAVSQMCESVGVRWVWMPVEDFSDVGRKLGVAQCAVILKALLDSGHCVYVHCNAGVGRSVAAVCAYLCCCLDLDLRKANFLMNAKRPVAYWDEKAMKYGVTDYSAKFGRSRLADA